MEVKRINIEWVVCSYFGWANVENTLAEPTATKKKILQLVFIACRRQHFLYLSGKKWLNFVITLRIAMSSRHFSRKVEKFSSILAALNFRCIIKINYQFLFLLGERTLLLNFILFSRSEREKLRRKSFHVNCQETSIFFDDRSIWMKTNRK